MSEPIVLPAGSTAWFISDLHLWEGRPRTQAAFLATLEAARRAGAALFILGDLFEYWVGDDDLAAPAVAPIVEALREATGAGLRIWFMRGNRDVLVRHGFARATGVTLIDVDEVELRIGAARALLMHGDTLCTDDIAYQRYRKKIHLPLVQRLVLAAPLAMRHALIRWMRRRSEANRAKANAAIGDVNAAAVQAVFARHGVGTLIHGHTHRPALHNEGAGRMRCVLSDWEFDHAPIRGDRLAWSGSGQPTSLSI